MLAPLLSTIRHGPRPHAGAIIPEHSPPVSNAAPHITVHNSRNRTRTNADERGTWLLVRVCRRSSASCYPKSEQLPPHTCRSASEVPAGRTARPDGQKRLCYNGISYIYATHRIHLQFERNNARCKPHSRPV